MSFIITEKGCFESSGKKVCSRREWDLRCAFNYGANMDRQSFTRLYIESRASKERLEDAYRSGLKAGGHFNN